MSVCLFVWVFSFFPNSFCVCLILGFSPICPKTLVTTLGFLLRTHRGRGFGFLESERFGYVGEWVGGWVGLFLVMYAAAAAER
jgi:hypothetical protein